ncbi:MAG: hypothetical protein JWO38_3601 [Gemmataceae bacterium]|nr:hypothetical protein [Gemmataceae bacterium]
MQTDAEPFLQRIRAFPDDDVPRLIFADWLEEQGGRETSPAKGPAGSGPGSDVARAAFIRVQVALAGLPDDDPRRGGLLVAERELLDAHRDEWEGPFRRLATGLVFRRGFVDEVNVDARQYLRHAHELFAAGPIRHIHLLNAGGSIGAVMQSPYLSRLRALTVFAAHAGDALARAVTRSPHLAELRVLHLGRNRLGDDAAEYLAGSPALGNLEELDLSENELGETGGRTLAASPHLANLRELEMRNNQLGPAGAESLAGSDRLASLHRLGLAGNDLGVPRIHSLTRVSDLLRVPALDLTANGLGPAALKAILVRPPSPPDGGEPVRLRELDLSHNELGEAGARVLADCTLLGGLKVLRLTGCGIPDDGVRALANSPHLNRLIAIDLGNNPVSDPGFRAFLDTPHLRGLRRLVVPGIGVSIRMRRALDSRFHRGVVRF